MAQESPPQRASCLAWLRSWSEQAGNRRQMMQTENRSADTAVAGSADADRSRTDPRFARGVTLLHMQWQKILNQKQAEKEKSSEDNLAYRCGAPMSGTESDNSHAFQELLFT